MISDPATVLFQTLHRSYLDVNKCLEEVKGKLLHTKIIKSTSPRRVILKEKPPYLLAMFPVVICENLEISTLSDRVADPDTGVFLLDSEQGLKSLVNIHLNL